MRKTFLSVFLLCAVLPPLAADVFPSPRDGVYHIIGELDMENATVTLAPGSTLDLTQGSLRDGTLIGDESRLRVDSGREVLSGVLLKGHWCGEVQDRWFRLEGNSPYGIVSSVFKFNEVTFFRDAYWLETWYPVTLNRDWMEVHGNGVRLYLPSDKGDAEKGKWGYKYKLECLFSNPVREAPGGSFVFEDIRIEDNASAIRRDGWGQDMETFRVYFYFEVTGRELVFRNVSSDGMGVLVQVYNLWQHIDRIEMDGCSVKAGQFALEVGNLLREGYPGGSCSEIVLRNCRFIQYPCQPYVGLLSVVGDVLTERMLVESCYFDGSLKDGNLELSSVAHVVFRDNTCINQFTNSYLLPRIKRYDILDNTFLFRKRRSNVSFGFGGEEVVFKNNRLVYEEEDVGFISVSPQVRSLEMNRNVFDFSRVETMTADRTAIALKGADLTGLEVKMYRNRVIPPPGQGKHHFIFRLPERMSASVANRLEGVLVR